MTTKWQLLCAPPVRSWRGERGLCGEEGMAELQVMWRPGRLDGDLELPARLEPWALLLLLLLPSAHTANQPSSSCSTGAGASALACMPYGSITGPVTSMRCPVLGGRHAHMRKPE